MTSHGIVSNSRLARCVSFVASLPTSRRYLARLDIRNVTRRRGPAFCPSSRNSIAMATRHQPPASLAGDSAASGSKSSSQDLLYDPSIPSLSHAERARTICALASDATLCTLAPDGTPYGSVVLFSIDDSGDAVLLISEMAEHTKNLHLDKRCSLLVREIGKANVLAGGRVTLVGRAVLIPKPTELSSGFLRKNPAARQYADFGDFNFWRICVSSIRYIGGFGRMSWVGIESWRLAREDPISIGAVDGLISDLNDPEMSSKLAAISKHFSFAKTVTSALVTAVDQYGFEVSSETEHGARPIRIAFKRKAESVNDVHALVDDLGKAAGVC
jgi:heme iron utilization protein